jgi:cephalosporin-C deacetylase-like acetyl esterase
VTRRNFVEVALATAGAAQVKHQPKKSTKGEFGYVDWSWDRWHTITGDGRPSMTGEQSGKGELIDLAPKNQKDWPARRNAFVALLAPFLGTPPLAKPPLQVEVLGEYPGDGFKRRKLRYQSEPGEWIPAYILIPDKQVGRSPAVLCPHQTIQAGKDSPAGLADNPEQHIALRLAQRGYVTLTWDALCFGERHNPDSGHYGDAIPFYKRHPKWSLMSKMIWDLSRGIDYLETLDFVDQKRIGCLGHSHGGITTLFGMALEPRIAAGCSNCGFDTFRIDGNTFRWSRATALLPRLGFYTSSRYLNMNRYRAVPDSEVITTPFDMHQLLALIAPRPLMLSASDDDFVFPNGGWSTRQSLARLSKLYRLLDAENHLASYYFRAGHSFPEEASSRAYAWIDRWLKA